MSLSVTHQAVWTYQSRRSLVKKEKGSGQAMPSHEPDHHTHSSTCEPQPRLPATTSQQDKA